MSIPDSSIGAYNTGVCGHPGRKSEAPIMTKDHDRKKGLRKAFIKGTGYTDDVLWHPIVGTI
jgi:hypothetical protein